MGLVFGGERQQQPLNAAACLFFVLSVFVLSVFMVPAFAGEIALKNGDVIKGELVEIKADKIIWKSDLFGALTVPKIQVLRMDTLAALKVRGESDPCYWRGLLAADAFFECEGGRRSIPFLAIQQISLFEIHQEITRGFTGRVFVSGSESTGNKVEASWVADAESSIRYTDFRHDLRYTYDTKSIASSSSLEHYRAKYDFNWFFAPRTYWIWSVDQEKDDARNIVRSTSAGTGVGYQLWESAKTAFSLESSADHVGEVVLIPATETEAGFTEESDYASLRLSSKFRYLFPFDIAFSSRNEVKQSLDQSADWKLNTDTGVSLPFGFGISADIRLLYEFQNMPAGENRKEDTTLRFGVGYNW